MSVGPGLLKHEDVLTYIMAGSATFTIHNPKTEGRITFKISKHAEKNLWFVRRIPVPSGSAHHPARRSSPAALAVIQ